MKSLPYVGFTLAILGASSSFAQDNDGDRSFQSLSPPTPPLSRLTRRTPSGAAISTVQSDIVINDRERLTISVIGDKIVAQDVNVPEGVSSAYFTRFNRARCFFHSKNQDGQFVSPVFPSLDLDNDALGSFDSDPASGDLPIEEHSQLRLPPDQTPFMADEMFCFYPPLEFEPRSQVPRRSQSLIQQQAIVLVEYSDSSTETVLVDLGNLLRNNRIIEENKDYHLDPDTNVFGDPVGPSRRAKRTLLLGSGSDNLASVRRAAVITASDRERTRCFFVPEESQRQLQLREQAFTWQSPMFTPVDGVTAVACESVKQPSYR